MKWVSINDKEKPIKGERIEIFSPIYPKGDNMRHRIIDEQFLSISTDATYWRRLTDPESEFAPPPPVQSDSGVDGKILQMAMARHPVSESKMIAYKEGLKHGYQLAEPKTKELREALEDILDHKEGALAKVKIILSKHK